MKPKQASFRTVMQAAAALGLLAAGLNAPGVKEPLADLLAAIGVHDGPATITRIGGLGAALTAAVAGLHRFFEDRGTIPTVARGAELPPPRAGSRRPAPPRA